MRESVLKAFIVKGFLPPKEVVHWRAPEREEFPQPQPDKVVSFLTFRESGLGYPMHWFLRWLLNEWGLELQHLNPTGVLHIAGFITVCEAFLGMEPPTDFFQLLFSGRTLSVGDPPEAAPVGGFALQKKTERGGLVSRVYPLRLQPGVTRGVVLYQEPGGGVVPGVHR